MKRTTLLAVLIGSLLTILPPAPMARAGVVASVDRERMAMDETVTLTIRKDSSSFFSSPDLSPLEKDFKVLGSSHNSSTQIINGQMTSSVAWQVTLAPKHTGRLEIPPLSVGGDTTTPLFVTVTREAPPQAKADGAPLFIETEVSSHHVLVQEQVLFTLRIYWAVQAQINDPNNPHIEDALLERLDDNNFTKEVNGRSYHVFERTYAIFPQKSGTLTIPQMVVQAMLPVAAHDFGGFFNPFVQQGREVQLRSRDEAITVEEKPAGYPDNAAWLPTNLLNVKEEWSHSPEDLQVGESTTVTITTTGQGLLATQLPAIELAEQEGIKLYQNKPEEENHKGSDGITGSRRQSIALIPTRPGTVTLPAIRIPWWNKKASQVEYAEVPAKELRIHGTAPQALQPVAPQPPPPQAPAASGPANAGPTAISPDPAAVPQPTARVWQIVAALLAIAWLITLALWWRSRQRLAKLPSTPTSPLAANGTNGSEAAARKALDRACQASDAAAAKQALIHWARAFWPEQTIRNCADLERIHPDPALSALLGELDSSLYGRDQHSDQWNGMRLLAQVQEIRKAADTAKGKRDPLPSLYRGKG